MKLKEAIYNSIPVGAAEYLISIKPELPKPKYKIKNKYIYNNTTKVRGDGKPKRTTHNFIKTTRKLLSPDRLENI